MEEKIVSFNKLKVKVKLEEMKRKVVDRAYNTAVWCARNKEIVIPMVAGGVAIARTMSKIHSSHREDKLHDCRHWDPRAGEYVWTRRPLKNSERMVVDQRYRNGESKLQIYYDMGLLR